MVFWPAFCCYFKWTKLWAPCQVCHFGLCRQIVFKFVYFLLFTSALLLSHTWLHKSSRSTLCASKTCTANLSTARTDFNKDDPLLLTACIFTSAANLFFFLNSAKNASQRREEQYLLGYDTQLWIFKHIFSFFKCRKEHVNILLGVHGCHHALNTLQFNWMTWW